MKLDPGSDLANLPFPDAAFVQHIDVLLQKDDPSVTIPWRRRPRWARPESVKHMVDIGAGVGRFTQSVTSTLGRWGAFAKEPTITLVDGDQALFGDLGVPGARTALEVNEAVRKTAHAFGVDAKVRIDERNAAIRPNGTLFPLSQQQQVDLIVASHVTYYFSDGSGLDFARACSQHISPGGLLWLVIRREDCPIYRARAKLLSEIGLVDPKPFDYAEHFLLNIKELGDNFRLVVHSTKLYALPSKASDRLAATHLLMWRDYPDMGREEYVAVASLVAYQSRYPFSEEHIVLLKV